MAGQCPLNGVSLKCDQYKPDDAVLMPFTFRPIIKTGQLQNEHFSPAPSLYWRGGWGGVGWGGHLSLQYP